MRKTTRLYCDGGESEFCYIIENFPPVVKNSVHVTHNENEYRAIIAALEAAVTLKLNNLEVFSDSEWAIRQINQRLREAGLPYTPPVYKIKDDRAKAYSATVLRIVTENKLSAMFYHVRRERNPAGHVLEVLKRAKSKSQERQAAVQLRLGESEECCAHILHPFGSPTPDAQPADRTVGPIDCSSASRTSHSGETVDHCECVNTGEERGETCH